MPANKKKRLFIAINLPTETRKKITELTADLIRNSRGVKWIQGGYLHITLHFLGDTDLKTENLIKIAMQSLENKFSRQVFKIGRIGGFPNLNQPRIIFLDCKQINGNSSVKLQEIIGGKLKELGLKVDRRGWKPHITIGRVREGQSLRLPDEISWPEAIEFNVESFDLMSSDLKPDGAVYSLEASYKLN